MQKLIKKIATKIMAKGKGLFTIIDISKDSISWNNAHGTVFSFQINNDSFPNCGTFAAGIVHTYTEKKLSFASEYQSYEEVETPIFKPYHIAQTDNPSYIIRQSLFFTLNQ